MKIKKINPPNYGFLDVTLEKNHTDFLYSLIEKYEPKESYQQWMLVDDNNRFQKEVLNEAIKEYLKDIGYYFSKVETVVENFDNNLVNITHKIDLGNKAKIKKCDEETLGQLFSYFILEISIVGKILGINPFDQPAVELIKKETNKILI